MITRENYYDTVRNIAWDQLPAALYETHQYIDQQTNQGTDWTVIGENPDEVEMLNLYFEKLQKYLNAPKEEKKGKKKQTPLWEPEIVSQEEFAARVLTQDAHSTDEEMIGYFIDKLFSPLQAYWLVSQRAKFLNNPSAPKMADIYPPPGWQPEKLIKENVSIPKQAKTPKKPKQKKVPATQAIIEQLDKELVETLPEEIRIFKRMVNMNGKIVERKAVLNLLNYLQKAILERRIRKDSVYAVEMMSIQRDLINRLPKIKDRAEIRLTVKTEEYFRGEIEKYELYKGVALLKRYISMHGKPVSKEKADRLLKDMRYAVAKGKIMGTDRYYSPIQTAMKRLEKLSNEDILKIETYELNGIGDLLSGFDAYEYVFGNPESCGCSPSNDGVIKMGDIMNARYDLVDLRGKWGDFLGQPEVGFSMAVTGPSGGGKSTFALALATYLIRFAPVLYVSYEMSKPQLQQMAEKIGVSKAMKELNVAATLPADLSPYGFIIVDSVTESGIKWEQWKELMRANPKASFIFLMKSLKTGVPRGDSNILSDTGINVRVNRETKTAYTDKNRFAPLAEMPIPGLNPMSNYQRYSYES